jgi:hypothetical protein
MSHKQRHAPGAVPPSATLNAVNTVSAEGGTRRRTMLIGLIAVSAAVIVFGILNSRTALTQGTPAPAARATAAAAPALASLRPVYDFGSISMAAGTVRHTYAVSNTGSAPVTIVGVQTSCMCTGATVVTRNDRIGPFGMAGHGRMPTIRETVAPGAMIQVEVTFDPAAHGPAGVGRTERVVTLETDRGAPLELGLTAMVRP